MATRPQGQVLERSEARGLVYALRFMADGKRRYQTLGTAEKGWTRARAEAELQNVLADVRRGIWQPPQPKAAQVPQRERDPLFHDFASEWFDAHKGEWREKTRMDYEWQLSHHLLPFFRHHRLSQITVAEVDRYRSQKVKQKIKQRGETQRKDARTLSAASINKTITRLAQILETAVEYELIVRNPAKGKRRHLKAVKPAPVWLDSAEQIEAPLDAAGELDRAALPSRRVPRRTILSTLVLAGLRIGELGDLRWRDVNLADGRLTVRAAKTDAGVREVELLPALRDELAAWKATAGTEAEALVFPSPRGGPMDNNYVNKHVLKKAVVRANKALADSSTSLPEGLTPHKLRHTYCSVLVAIGTDPGAIMDQIGHADSGFTLRVYRHAMKRDQASKGRLRKLVGADGEALTVGSGTNSGTNTAREQAPNPRTRAAH